MSHAFVVLGFAYYLLALLFLVLEARKEIREALGRTARTTLAIAKVVVLLITAYVVGSVLLTSALSPTSAHWDKGALVLSHVPWRAERIGSAAISPTGWQNSHFVVHKGERLTMTASGRVTTALAQLLESVHRRLDIERRHRQMGIGTDTFSQAEMDSISTLYDWVGPEGYGQYTSTTTPGREQSLLMPVASYGALIALIGSENGPPERPEGTPFLVGARVMDREVERDGVIWFAVNDVGFYPNRPADFHRIWYRDNAGVFFVTIVASQ